MIVTHDFETKSFADLKKTGEWVYSEHATTEVICLCYKIGGGTIQEWWPGMNGTDDCPPELVAAIERGDLFEAHKVSFELSIWRNVMVKRYGWPVIPLVQYRDSMATASYFAMPPALDRLCRALGLPGKDPEGGRLITKYSKLHLKTAKQVIPDDDFFKFVDYCRRDVEIEHEASEIMGDLPEIELPRFLLDLEMNLRGLHLDVAGIEKAAEVVDMRSEDLTAEFVALVGVNPTQRDKCMDWFAANGLPLENMTADYLGDLLEEGEIPAGPTRRALQIRLEINKASTKKLDAMARQCGSDGRARFQTRYHGAVTGRNTGSGFQPLNLNRGFEGQKMPDGSKWPNPEALVGDIMAGDPAWLDMVYGDAMEAVAKASRHFITAEPGSRIIGGDFVSIEAVILACGAGEEWKIQVFRNREPVYERTADKIYGYAPGTVTKATHPNERQDGKRCELAFGYQGALNAWLKFDPRPIHSDETIIGFCKGWRKEHPATAHPKTGFWRKLEDAAIQAVSHPGDVYPVFPATGGDIPSARFEVIDQWLTMQAPNGKRIWYFEPQLRTGMPKWHDPVTRDDCAAGRCNCKPQLKLTYMAQKEGQWKRVYTYGGKLCENWCQFISREILEGAKARVAAAKYPLILTVYDEIVGEAPVSFGSRKEFEDLMAPTEDWCKHWPISVDVSEGFRYAK